MVSATLRNVLASLLVVTGCGGSTNDGTGTGTPGGGGPDAGRDAAAAGGRSSSGGTSGTGGVSASGGGLNCQAVDCAFPLCMPGRVLTTPPGKCCPICVMIDAGPERCDQADYTTFQSTVLDGDALACSTDADCTIVSLGFSCRLDCGTAVSTQAAANVSEQMAAFSQLHCAGCPVTDVACPPVVYTAVCDAGQCVRRP